MRPHEEHRSIFKSNNIPRSTISPLILPPQPTEITLGLDDQILKYQQLFKAETEELESIHKQIQIEQNKKQLLQSLLNTKPCIYVRKVDDQRENDNRRLRTKKSQFLEEDLLQEIKSVGEEELFDEFQRIKEHFQNYISDFQQVEPPTNLNALNIHQNHPKNPIKINQTSINHNSSKKFPSKTHLYSNPHHHKQKRLETKQKTLKLLKQHQFSSTNSQIQTRNPMRKILHSIRKQRKRCDRVIYNIHQYCYEVEKIK